MFLLREIDRVSLISNVRGSVDDILSSFDRSASHLCGKARALRNAKIAPVSEKRANDHALRPNICGGNDYLQIRITHARDLTS